MIHAIIDYDVGNIASLKMGFERAGLKTTLTSDLEEIKKAKSLILPGVGAFKPAMESLTSRGLVDAIKAHVKAGKPLLGICLGMQLLFEEGHEFGVHAGLGFIPGKILPIKGAKKLPHMGWNDLTVQNNHAVMEGIQSGDYVYFVHSFYASIQEDVWLATTDYGVKVPAIVRKNHVIGMQFHPEKSAQVGERLLRNYGRWVDDRFTVDGSLRP